MELIIIIVAVLVIAAILAAAGAFDRTRRVSTRRTVVDRPVHRVVEEPPVATEPAQAPRRVVEEEITPHSTRRTTTEE